MKKVISIIALVVAMVMAMSVSAFAADPAFMVAEDAVIPEGTTVTPAADSIAVETVATAGNYYGILLVAGDALPTVDNAILYIDQATAADVKQVFEVLPIIPTTLVDENDEPVYNLGDPLTLYISSNVAGAELIAIPMVYDEEKAAYVLGDIDNNNMWNSADALIVLQIGANLYEATATELLAADVDHNEMYNSADALLILQYGAGLIESL